MLPKITLEICKNLSESVPLIIAQVGFLIFRKDRAKVDQTEFAEIGVSDTNSAALSAGSPMTGESNLAQPTCATNHRWNGRIFEYFGFEFLQVVIIHTKSSPA